MKLQQIACALCLTCSSMAVWACEQPAVPLIPSEHELGARQRQRILDDTREYTRRMTEYVACLKAALERAAASRAPALSRTLLTQRYDGAIREFDIVATLFAQHVGSIDSLRIGRVVTSPRRTCIAFALTGKTAVLNDYAMLFYQRSGDVYVGTFPNRCPGLQSSAGSFEIRTQRSSPHIEELCAKDSIMLINGSHPGYTCRLGPFHELTQQQAADLLGNGRPRLDDGTVTVTPTKPPHDDGETHAKAGPH